MDIRWRRGFHRIFAVVACAWVIAAYTLTLQAYRRQNAEQLIQETAAYGRLQEACGRAVSDHLPFPTPSFCSDQDAIYQNRMRALESQASLSFQMRQSFAAPLLWVYAAIAFGPPVAVYLTTVVVFIVVRWVIRGFASQGVAKPGAG